MMAWPLPDSIEAIVGATGVPGVTKALSEAAPAPSLFVALSAKEYVVPLVSPAIMIGLAVSAGFRAV